MPRIHNRMLSSIFAAALALGPLPAYAWTRTSNTLIGDLTPFNPAPATANFDSDTAARLRTFVEEFIRSEKDNLNNQGLLVGDIKAWPKATHDGVVVCFQLAPTTDAARILARYEALSISTGAFPGVTGMQPIRDEEAYNIVGCNTPGSTTIPRAQ